MIRLHEKNILERYLEGKASDQERNWLEQEFANGNLKSKLRDILAEDWKRYQYDEEYNLDYLLQKIHEKIREREIDKKDRFFIQIYDTYSRIAAILLIPLILSGILYIRRINSNILAEKQSNAQAEITAPPGSRIEFVLPDGSRGFLNSGSKLSYSIPFEENRLVTLNGEAWFDVIQDPNHSFEVKSSVASVKVLGTSFNVNAYEENDYFEVYLQSGAVEFISGKTSKSLRLNPTERLRLKDKSIVIDNVESEIYKGWTEGKLVFHGNSLIEVAERLSRWFHVEVEIKDKELEDYVFRATFIDDSLVEVLQFLSLSSPIDYKITERRQLSDNRWEKQIVTLTRRKM
jgi:transmembrane sensor